MKLSKVLALAAVAATAISTPAAAAPGTVTFRAEGRAATLVPATQVTTTTAKARECSGTSVLGALEAATGGDWDGTFFPSFGDYFVTRIKTESPRSPDGFSFYVNGRTTDTGACGTELQQGDDVLFFVSRCETDENFNCTNPPVYPLDLEAPASARPGVPFVVRVVELPGDGTRKPVQGATINGEGISATTTDADGLATVRRDASGPVTLQATKENRVRSAPRTPCVSNGQDGACGSPAPGQAAAPAAPAPAAPAPQVVRARFTGGPREGATYRRGAAPRTLRGSVPVFNAGIDRVRLRLTRNDRGRCSTLDAGTERLVRTARCGATRGRWFVLGDRADFEYQLPLALPRGRYVLDLQVRDTTGRVSRLERGNTRTVFTVR